MAYIGKRPTDTFPATNAITTVTIADNAVTSVKIAENNITTREIAANTIATGNIADNAVDGTKIAQNSILTRHIDDGQVGTAQIAADAITGAKLADDAVDSEHFVDGSIDTAHIADDAVTLAKMAGLARGKIIYGDSSGNPAALALGSNGQVLTSDGTDISWGTDAVLSTENVQDIAGAMFSSNTETGIAATYEDGDGTIDLVIGDNSIVASMIAENVITSRELAANTIATGNIADNAVDGTKIAQNSILTRHIDDNQVTADQIADDAVGADQLATNSVVTASIVAGSVTTTEIAANTIATSNIADNAVDGTKIAQNSILTKHIDDAQVTTAQLGADAVTGAKIADDAVDSEHLVDGSIDTAHIADDQVTAAKLADTAVTAASYGSSSAIPVITIDAQGRITAASTAATSSTLTIAADSGSNDTVTVGTDTLTFEGTANEIETTVSNNKINVGLPTNVTIAGNLTVAGTTTEVSSTTINVADPLVSLATSNNSSDAVDIGIYGLYDTSGSQDLYSGLFRDASDSGKWKLFKDTQAAPTTTVNTSGTGYAVGTLVANLEGDVTGNLTGTASAIANNSVTSAKIVNGTIVSGDIANNAILTQHIDDDQVTADQIAAATITTTQIAANTIATGNIADNAIDGTKIAQNSILTRHIDDAQVTADQLASSAVTTAKINADAVTGAKIADDAIDSEHYTDGSIDTAHIADDQVTLAKMAGLARGKIIYGDSSGNPAALALGSNGQVLKSDGTDIAWAADSGLSTEEVQDIAGGMFSSNTETGITATYQDADGTIDLEIGAGAIVNSMLADDAVGADELAANSVVSASIVNGSIVSADIAANTIATSNIADNAVDATKIASNSILTRHIDDNQITGDQIADDIVLSGTGAIRMPDGTTAQRPGSPAAGMFRYNTTTGKFEGYTDSWGDIGGGGAGAFSTDTMTGDGSDTTLTLSQAPDTEEDVMVFIDGVFQAHDTYAVSGTTLTFSTAPANNRVVTAYTVKSVVSGTNLTHDAFSGDGSDTTFTLSISPVHENNTQVYVDGVYQFKSTYSISGTTLTFSTAPPNGTAIEVMTMNQTDINVPVDDTITTAKIADNAVTAAKIASGVLTDQVAGISSAANATAMTIDSNEKIIIGATASHTSDLLQIETPASGGGHGIQIRRNDSNTDQGIGSITFGNNTDTDIAKISAKTDGANDNGALLFSTQPDSGALTERMRITHDGDVGIGATPVTAAGISRYLHINGGDPGIVLKDATANDVVEIYNAAAKLIIYGGSGGTNADSFAFDVPNNRLGIGTTSPDCPLHINGSANSEQLIITGNGNANRGLSISTAANGGQQDAAVIFNAQDTGHADYPMMTFQTGGTERMRITPDGKLFIGDNSFGGTAARFAVEVPASGAGSLIKVDSAANANETMLQFQDAAGQGLGSITSNPSANTTAYGTSSDYRLKENIVDMTNATARLKQLKPKRFNWKKQDSGPLYDGFLAHEVSSAVPEAIIGDKDAKDSDDNPIYQQIDHSKLVPLLVKTIQELEARITTLEG